MAAHPPGKWLRAVSQSRLAVVLGVAVLGFAIPAQQGRAQAQVPEDAWLAGQHATGQWGGLRPALATRGIEVGAVYTAELSHGRSSDANDPAQGRYQALLDAWLALDTRALGLWSEGQFFVGFQHVHGRGRSETLYTFQTLSNIDVAPMTQLGECFYEQHLANDRFWFRIGKQDTNRDLGAPRYPGNFVNNTFGALPTVLMPSFPTAALGAMLGVVPAEQLRLRAGVFDGGAQPGGFGVGTAFDAADDGRFSVLAVELVTLAGANRRSAGNHSLGLWHHSGAAAGAARHSHAGHSSSTPAALGLFVVLDQRIFADADDLGNSAGLHLFGRAAATRAEAAPLSAYLGGGLAYHAPWTQRPDDTAGTGFGTVWMERPTGGRSYESFFELFYKARLTPFFSLHPDLQYVWRPGGDPGHAVAVNLRLRVKL